MSASKGMSVFVHNGTEYNINDPNVANEFSTSTAYTAGDYVTYQGALYRFTADHSAGAWNSSQVESVSVAGQLKKSFKREGGITNDNKASVCGSDCNGIPNNTYYGVSGDVDLSHEPFDSAYYTIATFGKYADRTAGDFQIATKANDGETRIRTYRSAENGWSSWIKIPNGALTFMAGNESISTANKQSICGGDCNGIPNNTFYGVGGDTDLSHEPFENAFYSIATFGKYSSRSAGDFQIATKAADGTTMIRTYRSTDNGWLSWIEIPNGRLTFVAGNESITADNKQAICGGDCDNIPNNMFYGVGGDTDLAHEPVDGRFYSIATFGKYAKTSRTAGDLQLASDTYNGRLLYRNYHNSTDGWEPWKMIQQTITDEAVFSGIEMFERFGLIGGSFTCGPILPGESDPLNQNFNLSWGQILARKMGITCVNYGEGGCGTYRFLDTTARDYSTHLMGKVLSDISGGSPCGLYLLTFGINDSASWREFGDKHGGLEYLGSSADVNTSDWTQNANSFWGNYGKIIQQIEELVPTARLIMCTYCREKTSGYAYDEYNQAIQEIAAFFELPCIVITEDYFFKSSFYIDNLVSNHPTAPQYVGYAAAMNRLISRCIVDNLDYFEVYKKLPE